MKYYTDYCTAYPGMEDVIIFYDEINDQELARIPYSTPAEGYKMLMDWLTNRPDGVIADVLDWEV